MPRATITKEATRVELKSCPGGFVAIKQLPYHEMLVRRDKGGQFFFDEQQQGRVEIATLQAWARAYEFKHCIDDHNLEDEDGKLLDFSKAETLSVLDPRIGAEIEDAIDKLHNLESDVKDLPQQPSSSLEVEKEQDVVPDSSLVTS
jgi:hypothetical protein